MDTPPSIVVLGPERPDPILPRVLDDLGVTGAVALISAGWRHDEARDEPLREAVRRPVHNLRIYAAFRHLERESPELVSAYTRKQEELRHLKEHYRTAIVPAMKACQALYLGRKDPGCPWFQQAVANLREIDDIFLREVDRLHRRFDEETGPRWHPRVRGMVDTMREVLDRCDAVLIAGGHVGVLRNRLAFFGFDQWLQGRRLIAWSGGAMCISERVLLFHDHTNWGVGIAEYLDRGLGLLPGVVFLPHARARLDLEADDNVAILARRLAPRLALGLENGAVLRGPDLVPTGRPGAALRLREDGRVVPLETRDA